MKRSPSDRLSVDDSKALQSDLERFVLQHVDCASELWQFQSCGTMDSSKEPQVTEKMAPKVTDLIKNSDLLKIFLKYFNTGRMRDSYVEKIMRELLHKFPWMNNTKYDNNLFLVWFKRCCHLQISHLRCLKMYPCRYEYRVSRLEVHENQKLNTLLDMIQPESPNKKAHCDGLHKSWP